MVSFDFTLHLRVRNVGNDVNRIGIRGSVQRQIQDSNGFVEISQTETVYHENNVNFKHRCLLPYRFGGQEDTYMITIYGVRDESGVFTGPLGKVVFQIASIISAGGNRSFPLFPNCFLDIYVSLSETYSQGIRLAFSGHSLHSPDGRPIASYMALILCTPERNILLYKSPVRKGEKHPVWPEFVLPLHLLQYYPNAPLQLHCFNYNVNAADSLIGYFSTTLTQLQVGPGTMNIYMLTDQHGARLSEKTNIVLTKMEPQPVSNILQLFQNNMNIGLGTAIDLTASNGKPDDPSSLHFVHPYSTSAYEHAMLRVLPHIAPLMSQPKIIALGFGAKVEPSYDLSHCFSLSRSNENAFVSGIPGLIEAYRSARIVVKPYAPTDFSEVIYYISKFAKAEAKNPHGLYFILIILTDGGPAQPTKTINAIVDSSPYPMSIIAVGVGSSRDFTSLKALESPYLKHTDGRQLARQNFRFVEAGRIDTDDAIALVPMDITSWAANKA